jgi:N-acetylglucosamine malate deacetylase 1
MMLSESKNILVLAPHTDDGEFGCGASISRWIGEGKSIYYAAFTSAEKSLPPGMPKDTLKKELARAADVLNIPQENIIIYDYPVREFPAYRQEILEDMITLQKDLKPDLVLLPSTDDTHQDHQAISSEGFRAFKSTSIIGYEMPWNNLTFTTNYFVPVEEKDIKQKVAAIKCYESQKGRVYLDESFVIGLARVRGAQIGRHYAEAFQLIRGVV